MFIVGAKVEENRAVLRDDLRECSRGIEGVLGLSKRNGVGRGMMFGFVAMAEKMWVLSGKILVAGG